MFSFFVGETTHTQIAGVHFAHLTVKSHLQISSPTHPERTQKAQRWPSEWIHHVGDVVIKHQSTTSDALFIPQTLEVRDTEGWCRTSHLNQQKNLLNTTSLVHVIKTPGSSGFLFLFWWETQTNLGAVNISIIWCTTNKSETFDECWCENCCENTMHH